MSGGGAIKTGEIPKDMPPQKCEQKDIPVYKMPNGDTAGARGAAIEALAREGGLV